MRILIVTPAPPRSRQGNRVSANRWVRLLRRLGHRATIVQQYTGQACDLLIALHAVASSRSIRRFRAEHPGRPLVLVLTGTDLYRDLPQRRTRLRVRSSMDLADRIVTLNTDAVRYVPKRFRAKVRCILQSAPELQRHKPMGGKSHAGLRVAVIGHLRREKDPLRTAYALRDLPKSSTLRAVHAGSALTPAWARRAHEEMQRNPRYRWLGELTPSQVSRLLTSSDLLVHSSRMEGGANTISEALRAGVPILASRVSGNVGLLGADHPGFFRCGDTRQLRNLLRHAERNAAFLGQLREASRLRAPLFAPAAEADRWRMLLAELTGRSPSLR